MTKPGYYAVVNGRQPGIYNTWDECNQQVLKYPGAIYKKFSTASQANQFIQQHSDIHLETNQLTPIHSTNNNKRRHTAESSNSVVPQSNYSKPCMDARSGIKIEPGIHPYQSQYYVSSLHVRHEIQPIPISGQPLSKCTIQQLIDIIGNRKPLHQHHNVTNNALLYTDGAARNNPNGPAGAGIVLQSQDKQPIVSCAEYLGIRSNNESEYLALVLGLELATLYNVQSIKVYCDSELIVKQIKNIYRVTNPQMKLLHNKVIQLSAQFHTFTIQHVLRHLNGAADQMSNVAIDERRTDCSNYYTTSHTTHDNSSNNNTIKRVKR